MSEQTETLAGFRNVIMVLREVAELAEKRPGIPLPTVTFIPDRKKGTVTARLKWHMWGDAVSYSGGSYAERKRLSIENDINVVVDAYGPELAWVANDPSDGEYNKDYFVLKAERDGVQLEIVTMRSDVGEQVTVIESGPQVINDGDTVQLVRQSATVWQPNITIGRRATPAYELESAPLVLAVEA